MSSVLLCLFFFFFNDTATTEIYTLSLTTLFRSCSRLVTSTPRTNFTRSLLSTDLFFTAPYQASRGRDRKSTRLNSSHSQISYAVFCLKKKKKNSTDAKHTRQIDNYLVNIYSADV